MANRYAIASGNWSNTATWDGGTLPTSADDVYTNTFTVNCDVNFTVISLRNTAATLITAGGVFNFNTAGVIANVTNNIIMNVASGTYISVSATSGTVTINVPNGIPTNVITASSTMFSHNGNCNLTISCIRLQMQTTNSFNSACYLLNKTSTGILTINGDLIGGATNATNSGIFFASNSTNIINGNVTGGTNSGNGCAGVNVTAGDLTVTGSVSGGGSGTGGLGINWSSSGVLTITGTLTGGIQSAVSVSSGTANIIGSITGGISNGVVGLAMNGGGSLNHIGTCQASAFAGAIRGDFPTTTTLTVTGPFLRNGNIVAFAAMTLRINAAYNPYFEFRTSAGVNVTYVDQATSNFPAITNVRNGITYASGVYTGTMVVPTPANVRIGVGTDNTIGTGIITATDLFNEIAVSPNVLAVRLRNVSTVDTTGMQVISLT